MSPDPPAAEDDGTEHRADVPIDEQPKSPPLARNILGAPTAIRGLDLSNILDQSGFNKIFAMKYQIPNFKIPEATLNRISEIITGADRFSKVAQSISSAFSYQERWNEQFNRISSDWFKTQSASQAQLAELSANLTRNFNFGVSDTIAKSIKQYAALQQSWLKDFDSTFELFKKAFYPPNLRVIEGIEFEDVEKVVMADAIALYGVPRTSIAEQLIGASSAAKRRQILGRRWSAISADCRESIENLKSGAVTSYSSIALAALDALDNNHTEAAQALTGSLIDSMLTNHFGEHRRNYVPARNGKRTNEAYEKLRIHEFLAFAPMWQVYQQYQVDEGDPIPSTFSRHATAHTVNSRQYNRRNAIQALLFATSLIYFFDQQSLILEARRRKAASQQSEP